MEKTTLKVIIINHLLRVQILELLPKQEIGSSWWTTKDDLSLDSDEFQLQYFTRWKHTTTRIILRIDKWRWLMSQDICHLNATIHIKWTSHTVDRKYKDTYNHSGTTTYNSYDVSYSFHHYCENVSFVTLCARFINK